MTIDGIEWYCLVKDDGKALIWAKEPIEERIFGSNNVWQTSTLRTYLNGDWLESTTVLKEKAVETDITTRSQINATDWITTPDKVFLLSEADLFGTFDRTTTTDTRDYTYGNSIIVPDENMRKFTGGSYVWLRSPSYAVGRVAYVTTSGALVSNYSIVMGALGVRPALWVSLAS